MEGGAEVGVVKEATEGGHSGPLMVNTLEVMVAMVVATALMEDMVSLLPPSLPMVEGDLMDHLDMIREVRKKKKKPTLFQLELSRAHTPRALYDM